MANACASFFVLAPLAMNSSAYGVLRCDREPAKNDLISNFKHSYIGFIFTHYKVWISSISTYDFILCALLLSFKCIYSYFNCMHYEPLVVPDIGHTIIFTGVPSQIYIFPFLRGLFGFHSDVSQDSFKLGLTWLSQTLVVNIWFFSSCNDITERQIISIVFPNDTKSTICWRASPNVKLIGDFSSTTGLDVQTFAKKKTGFVFWS